MLRFASTRLDCILLSETHAGLLFGGVLVRGINVLPKRVVKRTVTNDLLLENRDSCVRNLFSYDTFCALWYGSAGLTKAMLMRYT